MGQRTVPIVLTSNNLHHHNQRCSVQVHAALRAYRPNKRLSFDGLAQVGHLSQPRASPTFKGAPLSDIAHAGSFPLFANGSIYIYFRVALCDPLMSSIRDFLT